MNLFDMFVGWSLISGGVVDTGVRPSNLRESAIFAAMKAVPEGRLDVITLCDELKRRGVYEFIGGAAYIADCLDATGIMSK